MRTLLPLLVLVLISTRAQSQQRATHTLRGRVSDTAQTYALAQAPVVLLRQSDSVMVRFTRTDAGGGFELAGIPAGEYFLSISYPRYASWTDMLTIRGDTVLPLIHMITQAVALENVVVRGSPIRMRGDTLAFLADSFRVREGATVEELLKRLPGLQVNANGEITAMGERVQRVLVDGDEFFGDDPTLATRNIRADMVTAVQVFDRPSEQAAFTGVDDGQREKTINLKLKDEARKGYFGKVTAMGGLPDSWQNNAMVNRFKGKQKLAAYGLMTNRDRGGLDWQEETNYGGGMDRTTEIGDDGSIMMWSQGDEFDWGSNYFNEGLPRAFTAGTHFSDKWREDKLSLNGSYRFRKQDTEGGSRMTSQFILPDTQYINNEDTRFRTSRLQHRANAIHDIKIDSLQSLQIRTNGSIGRTETLGEFFSEALSAKGLPVNRGDRTTTNRQDAGNFSNNILWRKRFAKRGRTFSLNLGQQYQSANGEGFLFNNNEFFSETGLIGTDTTDQFKTLRNRTLGLNNRAAYTEGIGKKGILEFNYAYNRSQAESERLSFDKQDGKYTDLNEIFSNSFAFLSQTHNGGIGYRYSDKTLSFGFGGNLAHTRWKQEDLIKDTTRRLNFNNLLARANANWKIKPQTSLRFTYNARTNNPTIDQLQPVQDNINPLNIRIGNPDLKLSFAQNFGLTFNDYKVLGNRSIWASFNFNTVNNAFSAREFVDSLGRRVTQTINVNGNYDYYGNIYFDKKLGKSNWGISLYPSLNGSRFVNEVNGLRNVTSNQNYRMGVRLAHSDEDKPFFSISLNSGYNTSRSSIRPDVRTSFWTLTPAASFEYDHKPSGIRIETEANYSWRQRTSIFDRDNNVLLWNAMVNKKISKKQDLRLGIMANDILNQNLGFNRQLSSNFVTERSWVVLRRYWMLTLHWNFSKNGKPEEW